MLKLEYSILYHTFFCFATCLSNVLIKSCNILKHKSMFFAYCLSFFTQKKKSGCLSNRFDLTFSRGLFFVFCTATSAVLQPSDHFDHSVGFARNGTKGCIFKAFWVFSKTFHKSLKKETVNLSLKKAHLCLYCVK